MNYRRICVLVEKNVRDGEKKGACDSLDNVPYLTKTCEPKISIKLYIYMPSLLLLLLFYTDNIHPR